MKRLLHHHLLRDLARNLDVEGMTPATSVSAMIIARNMGIVAQTLPQPVVERAAPANPTDVVDLIPAIAVSAMITARNIQIAALTTIPFAKPLV